MFVRIRTEYFASLILSILGAAALFTAWFSRATLVFHLDEYAGGDLDYIAMSAFESTAAQRSVQILGLVLLGTAALLIIVGWIRQARTRTSGRD